jgi:hypothetical protein
VIRTATLKKGAVTVTLPKGKYKLSARYLGSAAVQVSAAAAKAVSVR